MKQVELLEHFAQWMLKNTVPSPSDRRAMFKEDSPHRKIVHNGQALLYY